MNDNLVVQLHRTLVDAIRRNRPASIDRPVTVAEIYQDLVPYRTARTAIGFDMNADYEHTLLRLLAGEGDLARIEPREVRDKLRMELESPNPDVGLFRNYAACDVWVSVDHQLDDVEEEDVAEVDDSWEDEIVGLPKPANVRAVGPSLVQDDLTEDDIDDDLEDELPLVQTAATARRTAVPFEIAMDEQLDEFETTREQPGESDAPREQPLRSSDLEAASCSFCGGDLPAGRMANFCPFCGTDQSQQPCPACGEMLEPLWRFCISCGARVRQLGDHVN